MDQHYAIKESDKISKDNLCEALTLPDEYSAYGEKFVNIITEFERMWDGDTSSIKAMQHRIERQKTDIWPIHSAPYRAGPKAREFKNQEIHRVLTMIIIGFAQTKRALAIILISKKDGSLRSFVDYRKLNAVTNWDLYPIPRMDKCIE